MAAGLTKVYVVTSAGVSFISEMSEGDALRLVTRWTNHNGELPDTVALHYAGDVSFVRLRDVVGISYNMSEDDS